MALASALTPAHVQAATGSVNLVAGHDCSAPSDVGNTSVEVANRTDAALTSIAFVVAGDGSAGPADTATWTWTGISIAASASQRLYVPTTGSASVSRTGYGFKAD